MAPFYDHQVGRFEAPLRLDDRETYLARARRARADATAHMFGALFRGLARALIGFVRGATLLPPQRDRHRTPRLTGGCG
ncbi:MAG: hypothetical protein ACREH3_03045 [Geminicoccales bacterium]